jgi:HSP20 family protein
MNNDNTELQTVNQNPPAKRESNGRRGPELETMAPATDIYERKDSLVVVMDVPGVDESSVDIQVERNLLTVSATPAWDEIEGHQASYLEYQPARFERRFTLSNDVDCSKIDATVRDGVLRIVLPKAEAALPRKIQVRGA